MGGAWPLGGYLKIFLITDKKFLSLTDIFWIRRVAEIIRSVIDWISPSHTDKENSDKKYSYQFSEHFEQKSIIEENSLLICYPERVIRSDKKGDKENYTEEKWR